MEQSGKTYAQIFSDFVSSLQFRHLPDSVVGKVKLHVLDSIGVATASTRLEYGAIVTDLLSSFGGRPQSSVIARKKKVPAPVAAFINGSLIHGVDFDDTHLRSVLHPSSFVLPAALAVAEERGSTGAEVITAVVAGFEVATRLGIAASGKFHHHGFHPTSIIGSFGAAVTAGKLLGLGPAQLATAMGITGSLHGAGLQEFLHDGTWTKRLHPGWAAYSGILAALLAEKGYTGPHRIVEGKYGLYNSYLGPDQFDRTALIEGLGETWETSKISYKLYPSCYATQIYMDSALTLKNRHGLKPEEIENVHVVVSDFDEKLVIGKEPAKFRPPTTYAAQFSLPYCLAVALARETIGLDEFGPEWIQNEEILSLAQKVTWSVDPGRSPTDLCGDVRITTKDNRVYANVERLLRGSPEKPVGDEAVIDKFKLNTKAMCSGSRQRRIIDTVFELDQLPRMEPLARLLRSRA